MSETLPFTKMHGCQNDYVYLNLMGADGTPSVDWPKIAQEVSKRDNSHGGADGLILVTKPEDSQNQARMVMFNADGSEGKMCGNGIRCVTKLVAEELGPKPSYLIETASGTRECFVMGEPEGNKLMVRVNMGRPTFLPQRIPVLFDDVMVMEEEFEALDKTFKVSCVGMGNPHCTIEVDDLDSFAVEKYGPAIEKHEVFPEGVNVEFYQKMGDGVRVRTWERGSGETQACGTGACAVAVCLLMGKQLRSPVDVELRGGHLQISWDGLREVWMTGEAVTVSTGSLQIN